MKNKCLPENISEKNIIDYILLQREMKRYFCAESIDKF